MNNKKNIIHVGALLFILNGIFYLIGEFIAAVGTGFPLGEVYSRHFISSLGVYPHLVVDGVPNGFSKLAILMNIDFVVTGIGFFIAYYLLVFEKLKIRRFSFLYYNNSVNFCYWKCISGIISRWCS